MSFWRCALSGRRRRGRLVITRLVADHLHRAEHGTTGGQFRADCLDVGTRCLLSKLLLVLRLAQNEDPLLGALSGRAVADGHAPSPLPWAFVHELPVGVGRTGALAIAAAALLADGPLFVALLARNEFPCGTRSDERGKTYTDLPRPASGTASALRNTNHCLHVGAGGGKSASAAIPAQQRII